MDAQTDCSSVLLRDSFSLSIYFSGIRNEVSSSMSDKKGLRWDHNHLPPITLRVKNIKQTLHFLIKLITTILLTDILKPEAWLVVSLASIMLFFFHKPDGATKAFTQFTGGGVKTIQHRKLSSVKELQKVTRTYKSRLFPSKVINFLLNTIPNF